MGGFSQMFAISELFRRTKRLRTICFTNGSKRRKPRPRTANKMAQKVKPENERKFSSHHSKDKFSGIATKNFTSGKYHDGIYIVVIISVTW